MATWRELRSSAEGELRDAGVDAPLSEARWMVERVSGFDGPELVMHERDEATPLAAGHLEAMIERRRQGEPLQYVLGLWQFLHLELFVDRRVLVPRPETEVVARVASAEAIRLGLRHGPADPWSVDATEVVVDLGTGSGALALVLASELPDAEVWAVDVSGDALAVARANVAGVGGPAATRVRIAQGSWFDALPDDLRGDVRLVVSNPPYIAEHEVASLPRTVIEWEPYEALVSGPTGLEAIEVIVTDAIEWLSPDGVLVCELAPHQAGTVAELARAVGFADVEVRADLTGRERALIARRAPAG